MFIPRRAGVCRRLDRVKGQAVSSMTKMEAYYGMSSPLAAGTDSQLVC